MGCFISQCFIWLELGFFFCCLILGSALVFRDSEGDGGYQRYLLS